LVSIIENWALILGIVVGIMPPTSDNYREIIVRIEQVKPVKGFPNLVQQKSGEQVTIRLRSSQLAGITDLTGRHVVIRARRGGPKNIFADPAWTANEPAEESGRSVD
jgi:hypothetical protein